jgi:hypothetical protein
MPEMTALSSITVVHHSISNGIILVQAEIGKRERQQ